MPRALPTSALAYVLVAASLLVAGPTAARAQGADEVKALSQRAAQFQAQGRTCRRSGLSDV